MKQLVTEIKVEPPKSIYAKASVVRVLEGKVKKL
jgi:hypothetical protein